MIELLVLIAIATIGVIYTSSTGEAESTAMAEKTAKEALNEAEGTTGIGILGIDVVARKMRDLVGRSGGAAVTADTLAEYRGAEYREALADDDMAGDDLADMDDAPVAARQPDHAPRLEDEWDRDDALDEEGDDWSDAAMAREKWDDSWSRPEDDDLDDDLDPDLRGDLDDGARLASAADRAPTPAPKVPPVLDTADAPIVDEFDPEQDELQIGYRPGEAGNGRIGIAEDPLRPGAAAVTLGGRCVAVVLGGYGKVRAHHIDLICEEGDLAA